jgi:predicted MFS family arabinose efflux permease
VEQRERRLYAFFAVNYFVQGLAGLAYEPLDYLLKDGLRLGSADAALFVTWMTLPLTFKPLFGLLTDLLPWSGRRRAPHMVGVSLLTSGAWAALALLRGWRYGPTLALLILVNVGTVLSDVVCEGVMVERGQERGRTGPYQAAKVGMLYVALVLGGLGGGWLAAHASFRSIFLLAAALPLATAAFAARVDDPDVGGVRETAARGMVGLREVLTRPAFWAAAAAIFLWSFSPFLGIAEFYYQSAALKLAPVFIGALTTAGGVAGALGAGAFARLSRAPGASARLARLSVLVGGPLSLLYVFYTGPGTALALTVLYGLTGVVFRLAWMDLCARACPKGAEATTFAAFMAVFNLAAAASNMAGGAFYDRLSAVHGAYLAMVALALAGSACTFAAWPLLRWAVPRERER